MSKYNEEFLLKMKRALFIALPKDVAEDIMGCIQYLESNIEIYKSDAKAHHEEMISKTRAVTGLIAENMSLSAENKKLKNAIWGVIHDPTKLHDIVKEMVTKEGCQYEESSGEDTDGDCPYGLFDGCDNCPIIAGEKES